MAMQGVGKRRLTERFPGLIPLRRWQRRRLFYLKMRFDGRKYAETRAEEKLPHLLFEAEWPLLNGETGFDMVYQQNKAYNLKLASAPLDGLLIRPGETFSFYHALHGAGRLPYREGLEVVNGVLTVSRGGGLCQLSSMLFWLFLHSPLTIVERHGHRSREFPSPQDGVPPGADATVSEGWLDLKVRNDTAHTFQIGMNADGERLTGALRTDERGAAGYSVRGEGLGYYRENGAVYEETYIVRRRIPRPAGGENCGAECGFGGEPCEEGADAEPKPNLSEERLFKNVCEICYPLPAGTEIRNGRGEKE